MMYVMAQVEAALKEGLNFSKQGPLRRRFYDLQLNVRDEAGNDITSLEEPADARLEAVTSFQAPSGYSGLQNVAAWM